MSGPVDVLAVMKIDSDDAAQYRGLYLADVRPPREFGSKSRDARCAVKYLIETAQLALDKAWEYGDEEPHFVRLQEALARVQGGSL